ncbi:hypothetical protein J4429_00805 [Candidatus Pacearchaeota archaeon]|nr:hypothetical protein [Candidatus Pacearchaeota archaeon]
MKNKKHYDCKEVVSMMRLLCDYYESDREYCNRAISDHGEISSPESYRFYSQRELNESRNRSQDAHARLIRKLPPKIADKLRGRI